MVIKKFRYIINSINKLKLKNKTPTIISSNCNGTFILHDLGLKFRTPTINLFFYPKDFIKFVENIDYYIKIDIKEVQQKKINYPVGQIDDIKVYFKHYDSFEQAKKKWSDRCKRINKENMYIIMTDRDGCTYEDIKRFDDLKYKNKVIFTNKEYKEIKSSYYIHGFEDKSSVGILSNYQNIFAKRYLDNFDYVSFLNN